MGRARWSCLLLRTMPVSASLASTQRVNAIFVFSSLSDAWQVEGGKVQECLRDGIVPALLPLTCTSCSVTLIARAFFSQFSQNASPLVFGKKRDPDAWQKKK